MDIYAVHELGSFLLGGIVGFSLALSLYYFPQESKQEPDKLEAWD